MEFLIFTSPIGLHGNNLSIEFALNILLEKKKHLIHISTFLEQINPSEFAKIINEAYIILVFANRERGQDPIHPKIFVPKE